jgi:hypothetical protein
MRPNVLFQKKKRLILGRSGALQAGPSRRMARNPINRAPINSHALSPEASMREDGKETWLTQLFHVEQQ